MTETMNVIDLAMLATVTGGKKHHHHHHKPKAQADASQVAGMTSRSTRAPGATQLAQQPADGGA